MTDGTTPGLSVSSACGIESVDISHPCFVKECILAFMDGFEAHPAKLGVAEVLYILSTSGKGAKG
jgi:hypothetical protein